MHSTGGGEARLHLLTLWKSVQTPSLRAEYLQFPQDVRKVKQSASVMMALMHWGWNGWLTVFHHDHGAHLRAVTLILALSLQSVHPSVPSIFWATHGPFSNPPAGPLSPGKDYTPFWKTRAYFYAGARSCAPVSFRWHAQETNGQWARAMRW